MKRASDELQEGIKLDPNNPERYFLLGLVYLKHRTPALAQIVFEHGLAQAPNSARLWLWLGLSQYLGDDTARAQDSVQKALRIDPGLVDGYLVLGDMLESDGRLAEASELFHQAIEKRPDLFIGYFYCGKVALENGETMQEQALTFLTKAIALNPDFADAHYEKGRALEQAGKLPAAAEEYKVSLLKNGNLSQAHYRLALIYRKLGQAQSANSELALFEKTKLMEKEKDSVLNRLEYEIREP
jgi:tetratricopeptide (TPR) repeat protein